MTTTERPAREVLRWSRTLVEPALRAAIAELPDSTQRIAAYHLGWADEQGRPRDANGGKAIRPALTLLSALAVGGTAETALPAAVAVELVHNFSLLHDDVLDRDPTRRHRPTAWTVFGVSQAILTGDALLALAFQVLCGSGHPGAARAGALLGATVQALIDGEQADLAFERRPGITVAECLAMSERKTGALMGCACAIGAIFGGADPPVADRMRAFGLDLGVAFQHVDDLLGIWGDPATTGKPVYADLRRRKKSLPVVAALCSATAPGRLLARLYQQDTLSEADLAHAAELIDHARGRAWSQARAAELLSTAARHLRAADAASGPAAELSTLARLLTHRDH
ncbi:MULTISPECIES: family 2 encapsulin nanocompartment cargo protein polyprenyl transferase [unclassified Crossiella]|uniref:family 2 encapsulin nanocompartment cargo protein polyprenyl transferase n=1 Tax=unclassified Crossiella TaxID=2620835 RepID=UPI002000176B|nr:MULTISPECIES: family 2 encapsulin nanocompartment cargo protein polyprenyl transferase [unclassified Crossiella]MCK2244398.1 polyprenyl synthetase family protein [Crossiella sp. S99.2]MCK2257774.1 polyprenyl synthetase family protein [Crossiella sp. S99.1]